MLEVEPGAEANLNHSAVQPGGYPGPPAIYRADAAGSLHEPGDNLLPIEPHPGTVAPVRAGCSAARRAQLSPAWRSASRISPGRSLPQAEPGAAAVGRRGSPCTTAHPFEGLVVEISQSASRRPSPLLVIPPWISPRLSRSRRHLPAHGPLSAAVARRDGHGPRLRRRPEDRVVQRWSYPFDSLAFRGHASRFACSPGPNPTNMERSQEEPSLAKNDAMVAADSPEPRSAPKPRP